MLHSILGQLQQLGLSENEAEAYLCLLRNGQSTASHLANQAQMDRSSMYRAIKGLVRLGLARYTPGKITYYQAANPSLLQQLVRSQQQKIAIQARTASKLIEEINAEIQISHLVSKIQVLEGPEVIKQIWEDMLSPGITLQRQLIRVDIQDFLVDYHSSWVEDYIKRRVAKKIQLRYLTRKPWYGLKYTSSNPAQYKEARLLPANFQFATNLVIYGNKVATHTVNGNEIKGVIIDDKDIAATQAALFDFLWQAAATKP